MPPTAIALPILANAIGKNQRNHLTTAGIIKGKPLIRDAMTEIQILLAMGAIAALMLCLISSLFYQRWPSQSWRALMQFWLLLMGLCVLVLISSASPPSPAAVPIQSPDPPPWYWLIGLAVLGVGYLMSWHVEQRDRQQFQRHNSPGIPGGLPQARSPYSSGESPPRPHDIDPAGDRTQRGSQRDHGDQGDRPPHPGRPGGIPQPPAPKAPSSAPPCRAMTGQRPLKSPPRAAGRGKGGFTPSPSIVPPLASPRLMSRLDSLTYNRELSERLIAQNLEKNPGRSSDWAADKAIWDIERDRR